MEDEKYGAARKKRARKNYAGPRNRTWVCSATTNCTNHYTRPADVKEMNT